MSRTPRKPRPLKFAIREPDGSWSPCNRTLNKQLALALRAMTGSPGTVMAYDDVGEAHVLSFAAGHVLHLAMMAMDARLRPGECYRERADELYTVLAGAFHRDGVQELRRVFRLGANRPWLVPDGGGKTVRGREP